jgi:hypothetical protein
LVSNRGNPFRRSQACQSLFRVAPSSRPHFRIARQLGFGR